MDPSWRTLGEVLLAAFVALQGWLLRKVWNSKVDRDEVLRMFEDWQARDDEKDEKALLAIKDEIKSMRSEARGCFSDVGERIDRVLELLANRAPGH